MASGTEKLFLVKDAKTQRFNVLKTSLMEILFFKNPAIHLKFELQDVKRGMVVVELLGKVIRFY